MVAQHHFTCSDSCNGFYSLPDLLSDAGGELRRAQGTGEVEMDNHPTALNLYLIQETKFAKRSADFGVTRRSSRFVYCITINRCCHRELVPAMPISYAVFCLPKKTRDSPKFTILL